MRLLAGLLLKTFAVLLVIPGGIGLIYWIGHITGLLGPPVIGYHHPWWEPLQIAGVFVIAFSAAAWGRRLAPASQPSERHTAG